MSLPVPRTIASARIAPSELSLQFVVNGEQITMTRNDEDLWIGNFRAPPNTSLILSIDWSSNGIMLASLEDQVTIGNSNFSYVLDESRYRLVDSDGDSFSNIAEIDAGTNHNDPNSFPRPVEEDPIFNSEQSNCATPSFADEVVNTIGSIFDVNLTYTQPDTGAVISTPNATFLETPIVATLGSDQRFTYPIDSNTLFIVDIIEVTERGLIRISHVEGAPDDSFGLLFERDQNGQLNLIDFDDDSGGGPQGLNTSLAVSVAQGGYCYFMTNVGFIPLLSGLTESDSPITIRYELLSE